MDKALVCGALFIYDEPDNNLLYIQLSKHIAESSYVVG